MNDDVLRDIESRADIEHLIDFFYSQVKTDPLLSYIFNDVAQVDWEEHTPVIVDFWETILLDNPVYRKNAMEVHYILHQKTTFKAEHFERWLLLFRTSVQLLFSGPRADLAIKRAEGIAGLMQHKMGVS
ncbi:MAG: group III truncated hemoglobin [Chitinophagaceae bacterium]|jgi:hemoglobin|nr:group III truncated hemoglobin [Chitinophagaceae bacterium]